KEVKAKIAAAEKEVAAEQEKIDKIQEKINDVQKKIYVQNMVNGVNGSQAAALQFQYEHALVEKHFAEAKELKGKFDEFKGKEIAGKDNLKGLQAEEARLENEIKQITEN